MGLTFRQTKGSALTIQELDDNFAYFTGSHPITGSVIISGSQQTIGSSTITGSLIVSGSSLSPLTLLNLPEFVDEAAAITAGLTTGMVYRNGDMLLIVTSSI